MSPCPQHVGYLIMPAMRAEWKSDFSEFMNGTIKLLQGLIIWEAGGFSCIFHRNNTKIVLLLGFFWVACLVFDVERFLLLIHSVRKAHTPLWMRVLTTHATLVAMTVNILQSLSLQPLCRGWWHSSLSDFIHLARTFHQLID